MWKREDDDGDGNNEDGMEDREILERDPDSDSNSDSDCCPEAESGSDREEAPSRLIFSSDQPEYTCSLDAKESPLLSDGSECGSPLGKYFDPTTSLLLEEVLEPASPVVGSWERRMEVRIREGRGLRAWIDWAVDRVIGRVQRAVEER